MWPHHLSVERMQQFPSKTGRAHDAALLCKWLESELVVLSPSDFVAGRLSSTNFGNMFVLEAPFRKYNVQKNKEYIWGMLWES